VSALVSLGKVIGSANDTVVKNIKRFVLAETAGVQVNTMGHITG
jgi:hypothetical protein